MTNEELVKKYRGGNKNSLEELIKQNIGIVNQIASKFYSEKTNSIDWLDLQQEGFIGLMIAAEKYDPHKKNAAKFITYAVFWIRQRVSRFLYQYNTNDEISLNTPLREKEDSELIDTIKDNDDPYLMIEEKLYIQELRADLEEVMNNYTSLKEREIIKLKYGWDGNRELTDSEIGEIFKLSIYQVNDIRNRTFQKMRNTPWGKEKARDIYHIKQIKSYQTVDDAINRIDFAEKYKVQEACK